MKKYLIMPYKGRWYEIEAKNHEMAYASECCWFSPMTLIAIMEIETGITEIFHRSVKNGQTKEIIKGVISHE